jgi:prepilin-type N-terminal cleavage/methylation domain-containing protein
MLIKRDAWYKQRLSSEALFSRSAVSSKASFDRSVSGFTLVELLVAMTIFAILGALFTRALLTQGRIADQQNAARGARMVARQGMNILESEIRMVQDSGGIDSASTDGRTIRVLVPYRMGLNCGTSGGKTVVSTLPTDSLTLAQARYAGFAWRNQVSRYTTVHPADPLGADAPTASLDPLQCTGSGAGQARIATLTLNGRSGQILDLTPPQPDAPKGQPVFLFQRVTYTFTASTLFPGQWGLYRTVQGGSAEEIMAPFDSLARFKYWTQSAAASVAAPPALALIRGVDVVFSARSSYTPMGRSAPTQSTVVASIFFRNVRAF